jgi:hypothetical protein
MDIGIPISYKDKRTILCPCRQLQRRDAPRKNSKTQPSSHSGFAEKAMMERLI